VPIAARPLSKSAVAEWPAVVVVQYQVVQTSLERIEIRLVLRRLLTGEEERYLRELVQNGLGHTFEAEIVVVDQIERATSGKYEDFRSEVG
jgi:phenylacetate-CoA ligase